MEAPFLTRLQQVHLGISPTGLTTVSSHEGTPDLYEKENDALQARLLRLCSSHLWPHDSHDAACPRPILWAPQHQEQLATLHTALATALTDVVERWWVDSEAKFPARMPLEKAEEDMLRWLDTQNIPYRNRLGSWRPDFLVEEDSASPEGVENFRITEINARFSFNGTMHVLHGQAALESLGAGENGITHATDTKKIVEGLLSLFDPERPMHLLKGTEPGMDIHMFIDFLGRHLGIKPRLITPDDLRLVHSPEGQNGYKLCCLVQSEDIDVFPFAPRLHTSDGKLVEEIQQVGLELHQRELFAMEPEMLRQVITRCFNDMRTVLLVHDKRMLGILKQEIPSLVARNVLTPTHGEALTKGIADTILPGSPEMQRLIQACQEDGEQRKQYLLKPVRGGKGAGILFGDQLDAEGWQCILERLRDATLHKNCTNYVVQRYVPPALYDLIISASGERHRMPLVGTYHAASGQLLGLGIWRTSSNRICAVSNGGSWICSVMAP
ncbi:uncharacterized protein KD926_004159 [Aspergillus affinis]|uniref:uncharacterized protein n=1 Tax=Aspergillus affinis TaxID=1070780 RepID=UPI0022FDBD45|nr:uncharacterized protein KD926_004159 [Aspergillus affinis]KAI9046321.1 hypothetical protein KD926_004159 [Aspergillus affinis]